jgi:hypothetical protein
VFSSTFLPPITAGPTDEKLDTVVNAEYWRNSRPTFLMRISGGKLKKESFL